MAAPTRMRALERLEDPAELLDPEEIELVALLDDSRTAVAQPADVDVPTSLTIALRTLGGPIEIQIDLTDPPTLPRAVCGRYVSEGVDADDAVRELGRGIAEVLRRPSTGKAAR